MTTDPATHAVQSYWDSHPCDAGDWPDGRLAGAYFGHLSAVRYRTHPYVPAFADFEAWRGCAILEIGLGTGVDFCRWAAVSPHVVGIDLSATAVTLTRQHLAIRGLRGHVQQANTEELPFRANTFDLVYSFGVLHHTPNIRAAIGEVWRVLRPGGSIRLMLYHLDSWVAWLTWLQYGLAKGRPWASRRLVLAHHMESPGTQAFTRKEVRVLCHQFTDVRITSVLTTYDLWEVIHRSHWPVRMAHAVWPRWLVRALGHRWGWNLLIGGRKPG